MKKVRQLSTLDEVVAALGGLSKLGRLIDRKPCTICGWRDRNTIPAKWYPVMTELLLERGFTAPRALWGFEELKRRAA
jgi:hypothetical protein